MNIKIVNKNNHKEKNPIYIGRPSIFGNPYLIGKDGSREEVISMYKDYLISKLKSDKDFQTAFKTLLEILNNSGELILECWCRPFSCHGDVIKELLEKYNQQKGSDINE